MECLRTARCINNVLNTPRRFVCGADGNGAVVVYRPFVGTDASATNGYLLVRWVWG